MMIEAFFPVYAISDWPVSLPDPVPTFFGASFLDTKEHALLYVNERKDVLYILHGVVEEDNTKSIGSGWRKMTSPWAPLNFSLYSVEGKVEEYLYFVVRKDLDFVSAYQPGFRVEELAVYHALSSLEYPSDVFIAKIPSADLVPYHDGIWTCHLPYNFPLHQIDTENVYPYVKEEYRNYNILFKQYA